MDPPPGSAAAFSLSPASFRPATRLGANPLSDRAASKRFFIRGFLLNKGFIIVLAKIARTHFQFTAVYFAVHLHSPAREMPENTMTSASGAQEEKPATVRPGVRPLS
ncbi:MAG: hypothetical protein EG822_09605 [Deltaproteobacteria bacterium]|nr:hypothetical protein [Deltaproteobacteria bacterium]TLN02900.1 MAG: hypothetical protein FDZ73_09970 [bacterium]